MGSDDVIGEALVIDLCTAKAPSAPGRQLRRQRQTGVVHRIFPRGPRALPPVLVVMGRISLPTAPRRSGKSILDI